MRGLTKFKNIPIMIGANTLYMLLFAVGLFLIFNGLIATISFSILVLLILLSIVAHELGHAFCARAFGYDTKKSIQDQTGKTKRQIIDNTKKKYESFKDTQRKTKR